MLPASPRDWAVCLVLGTVLVSCAAAEKYVSAPANAPGPDFVFVLLQAAGALALQLFGISTLSSNLQAALGDELAGAIQLSCGHSVSAFATGAAATAALTSATATSMMVVDFVDAGVMTFSDSLAVALGINVGSTAAPLISRALPIAKAGLPLIGICFFARTATAKPGPSASGLAFRLLTAAIGLGMLLAGMDLLSAALAPVKSLPVLRDALLALSGSPALGVAAGLLLTLLVQSSTASIAIAAELAASGAMPLPLAVAVAVGANIGTCASTLAAGWTGSRSAWRFAVAYTAYKVLAAAAVMPVFGSFVEASRWAAGLTGPADEAAGVAVACSAAHVLSNAALALVALPLVRPAAAAMDYVVAADAAIKTKVA